MPELTQQERLQPSLLDRLTDREPAQKGEGRGRRVMSLRKLRECVIRDLGWLFNTANLETTEDLEGYPFVRESVYNYGMPDLAGITASSVDTRSVEKAVRQAIWDFEPRILRNTVRVEVSVEPGEMGRNSLAFAIEGELWAQPTPTRLFLKTRVDLEDGNMVVAEQGAKGA